MRNMIVIRYCLIKEIEIGIILKAKDIIGMIYNLQKIIIVPVAIICSVWTSPVIIIRIIKAGRRKIGLAMV